MKITFGTNQILLNQEKTTLNNIKVAFTFGSKFLPNASKLLPKIKLSPLDDFKQEPALAISSNGNTANIIIYLGDNKSFDQEQYNQALQLLANFLRTNSKLTKIDIILEEQIAKLLKLNYSTYSEQTIFSILDSMYFFDELKAKKITLSLKEINFVSKTSIAAELKNAAATLEGVMLVKHLGNNPANIATPSYIAQIATAMQKHSKKVKAHIIDTKEAKKLKMGSFLSVTHGSDEPAQFITLEYQGGKSNQKPIVLVGKGVTFDAGGISIKPSTNMNEMKYDMLGCATVLGAFLAAVKLNLPINLVVLAPCTENLISGLATKPGDIVTSMSGKTIEIVNTDAEGRLILCDALTYAKRYNPEYVIDVATLTGASVTALGSTTALYSNDDNLTNELLQASKRTNDKAWQMPLTKEYDKGLKTSVADLKNLYAWGGEAGSVTAASFLAQFVDYKWAHLDIAGSGWKKGNYSGKDNQGGATGRPFYMLIDFLRNI